MVHRGHGAGVEGLADEQAGEDGVAAVLDGADGLGAGAHRLEEGLEGQQRVVDLACGRVAYPVVLLLIGPVGEGARN